MEDILAIILIFGGGTAIAIAFSPVGKAIADRIRGHGALAETDPAVLAELDDLRGQVSELQERVDFTERLLAKDREGRALGPGVE
ncbi:MAG TPA: hypothetical protein VFS07_04810 [Gemmatimonadales bacterium]|nr:hypothetical protein [Gemmatimonadales bacterium]